MAQLTETQTAILRAAAERDDRAILPLPVSLRGGAASRVIAALLTRGLIVENTIDSQTTADASLNRIWRNEAGSRSFIDVMTGWLSSPADAKSHDHCQTIPIC